MRFLALLTLLCSSVALASAIHLDSRAPKCPQKNGNKDDEIIAKYKTTGQCFSYIGNGNRDKTLAPCSGPDGYCQKVKGMTNEAGCKSVVPEGVQLDPGTLFKDEDCNQWYPGQCVCECELCDEISKIVIGGLEPLDKVICAVMLSSLKSIADFGLFFIPGGQASSASLFGNWVGNACGVPDFDFDITKVFRSLLGAPESMSRGVEKPAQATTTTKPAETAAQATTTMSMVTSSQASDAAASKRSFSKLLRENLSSLALNLFRRTIGQKIVKTTPGRAKTGYRCCVRKHATSSDAEKIPEIANYWAFKDPWNNQQCSRTADSQKDFDKEYKKLTKDEKNGFATTEKMDFPSPAGLACGSVGSWGLWMERCYSRRC
ncbi:hypothetical protein CkaCkLH20_09639 [Colletotrichum karsti]|uniref:Uncharacterized protein n=1 Tax=Colletotrichum karsti TaxID=1095194 RepID=A0A9P6LH17_9PEZI|nr:uncharacterized protein CkaCkLH20_09639 [Colletotrichum karsti]KAF9872776.1 hypothetical protein CkaCkLH20_09639 [Colletotrichum karsti]